MLRVEHVNAFYGRAQALMDVALHVQPGEVLALLGRNGAGKSTTLRVLMGLPPRASGQIQFMGQPLAGHPAWEIARLGIGYVPQERRIFAGLTVAENLEAGRQAPRSNSNADAEALAWDVLSVCELFPDLAPLQHRSGERLSGGEQRMLAIARAMMGNPRLLLLDEPTEGLAPQVVQSLARVLASLKGRGLAILLAEQHLAFAAVIADRALLLERGAVRAEGSVQELAPLLSAGPLGASGPK